MRVQDIIIGEFYRLKSNPNYTYVKPIRVLKPRQRPNELNYIIVECEHVINKNDTTGFIRYFKPVDIVRN